MLSNNTLDTRPSDRMQRVGLEGVPLDDKVFQSSPGLPTGCNWFAAASIASGESFQSSPGLPTGCNFLG